MQHHPLHSTSVLTQLRGTDWMLIISFLCSSFYSASHTHSSVSSYRCWSAKYFLIASVTWSWDSKRSHPLCIWARKSLGKLPLPFFFPPTVDLYNLLMSLSVLLLGLLIGFNECFFLTFKFNCQRIIHLSKMLWDGDDCNPAWKVDVEE